MLPKTLGESSMNIQAKNILHVDMTGIYHKLYYKKYRPYRIIEVF